MARLGRRGALRGGWRWRRRVQHHLGPPVQLRQAVVAQRVLHVPRPGGGRALNGLE